MNNNKNITILNDLIHTIRYICIKHQIRIHILWSDITLILSLNKLSLQYQSEIKSMDGNLMSYTLYVKLSVVINLET